MFLVGDIGGTNARLALFEKNRECLGEHTFPSKDYPDLKTIILEFLKKENAQVEKACFGIAGPIKNNICKATNLPWVIDGNSVAEKTKIDRVYLINDLEANAYGLRALKEEEFFLLNPGKKEEGNAALVSAGTGLGEAALYWDGEKYRPFASEGGHANFAPRDENEIELFRFLQKKFGGHVSYERVISGPGIYNLYQFLVEEKKEIGFTEEVDEEEMPKKITEAAMDKSLPLAEKVLEWFLSLYGSEAGNAALKFMALSGVYLGGGIAPKVLEKIKEGSFLEAFCNKGRFSDLLQNIPIKIVLNDQAALLGSLEYALLQK